LLFTLLADEFLQTPESLDAEERVNQTDKGAVCPHS